LQGTIRDRIDGMFIMPRLAKLLGRVDTLPGPIGFRRGKADLRTVEFDESRRGLRVAVPPLQPDPESDQPFTKPAAADRALKFVDRKGGRGPLNR